MFNPRIRRFSRLKMRVAVAYNYMLNRNMLPSLKAHVTDRRKTLGAPGKCNTDLLSLSNYHAKRDQYCNTD
jgi:hypothetical protein